MIGGDIDQPLGDHFGSPIIVQSISIVVRGEVTSMFRGRSIELHGSVVVQPARTPVSVHLVHCELSVGWLVVCVCPLSNCIIGGRTHKSTPGPGRLELTFS